ncbi:glycine betaine ABC transporter substrate-binding protein [Luteimicrobium subarcticum]|uniref:Osmoprotectant transport system substrate-binding protein n=1 Tax=Luteimicrobium subarcticum TaxID=620910 RepID=A0A2M8WVQ2_9MICO|nr:glycine betaine ABC transporter substrate-binding protein [Luteimicrobium subarcticum]PJI95005.1 osmoprotectant transport system substrate-binding protein [Luteimicrobium subarcticum]
MSPSLRPAPLGSPRRRSAGTRTLRAATTVVAALGLAASLAACGDSGSSGTKAPAATGSAAAATCDPVSGDQLVVLTDDKHLQTVDNIIPALNAKAVEGDEALVPLLDAVSASFTTDDLIAMNKAVDVDRQKSIVVAKQFFDDHGLAAQDSGVGTGKKVVIGAANFSENQTLAYLYQDVLVSAGYTVTVKTVGNRELYLQQLEKGDLTMVPEYTGTLTEFLNQKINGSDAEPKASSDLNATVTALTDLGKQVGLTFGKPAQGADQNAFAVTNTFADQHQVKTLSDLASKCGNLALGGPPECTERPFCQPGLEKTYGLTFSKFTSLDAGGPLTKTAILKGRVAIGLVFSSDGQLGGSDPTATSTS